MIQAKKCPTLEGSYARCVLFPKVAFIIFDVILFQNAQILLLKCYATMMLLLVGNVPLKGGNARLADRKRADDVQVDRGEGLRRGSPWGFDAVRPLWGRCLLSLS